MKHPLAVWTTQVFTALVLSASTAHAADDSIQITLVHHSAAEQQTADLLQRLLGEHDLSPWTLTRQVRIDETEIPHSHPVLTLHARHRNQPDLLLSTYVHEQLHWFLSSRPRDTALAIRELRRLFPKVPVGYPQGSSDARGNDEHLLVVALECQADQALLGPAKARQVMEFWADDHYTWIYRTVLDRPQDFERVIAKHHLLPGTAGRRVAHH